MNSQTGFLYSIQFSTNLLHWATLTNLAPGSISVAITDPAPISHERRFYRAVTPPVP